MADQQLEVKEQESDSTTAVRKVLPRVKLLTPLSGGGAVKPVYIAYARRWSEGDAADALASVRARLTGHIATYSVCAYAYNVDKVDEVGEAYHAWQARAYEVDVFHRDLEQEMDRTISYDELRKLLPKHLRDVDVSTRGNAREKDPAWVNLTGLLVNGIIHITKDNNPLPIIPEEGVPYEVTFGVHSTTGDLVVKRVDPLQTQEINRITFKTRIHVDSASGSNLGLDE